MIGRYRSAGISLRYPADHGPGWAGRLIFFDDGHEDDDPTTGRIGIMGRLHTYYVASGGIHQRALRAVTNSLIHDAQSLRIDLRDPYLSGTAVQFILGPTAGSSCWRSRPSGWAGECRTTRPIDEWATQRPS
jgi:hypothetical protein